ncbi:MAG: hypothetical protein ACOC4J_03985 [Bacteroidota bacterium]
MDKKKIFYQLAFASQPVLLVESGQYIYFDPHGTLELIWGQVGSNESFRLYTFSERYHYLRFHLPPVFY